MEMMIQYARAEGLQQIDGEVLSGNVAMLKMCRDLGFSVSANTNEQGVTGVRLSLS